MSVSVPATTTHYQYVAAVLLIIIVLVHISNSSYLSALNSYNMYNENYRVVLPVISYFQCNDTAVVYGRGYRGSRAMNSYQIHWPFAQSNKYRCILTRYIIRKSLELVVRIPGI